MFVTPLYEDVSLTQESCGPPLFSYIHASPLVMSSTYNCSERMPLRFISYFMCCLKTEYIILSSLGLLSELGLLKRKDLVLSYLKKPIVKWRAHEKRAQLAAN